MSWYWETVRHMAALGVPRDRARDLIFALGAGRAVEIAEAMDDVRAGRRPR